MESLLRYLRYQHGYIEKMLQTSGEPTEEQLTKYISSLAQQLCTKSLIQAPASVRAICFDGLKLMGKSSG